MPVRRLTLYELLRLQVQYRVLDPVGRQVVEPVRRWRNANRLYRPIFIAGAMGSGTSLLAVALGQRFDVAGVVYESARQVSSRSFLHVPVMGEFDSMDEYVAGIRPSLGWTVEKGRRDLLALYRSQASRPGEAIIDKGPNTNLLRADFLARCFPEAAWLVIYRDPVSTVEGFRRKWPLFGHESAEANARFWADAYQGCLAQLDALGRRVTIVDYGSLAAGMDEVFAKLGRELGLEPATGRRHLRSVVNIEGFGIRNVSHSRIGVVGDADARSLARVSDEDARVIRGVSDSVRSALEQRSSTRNLEFAS